MTTEVEGDALRLVLRSEICVALERDIKPVSLQVSDMACIAVCLAVKTFNPTIGNFNSKSAIIGLRRLEERNETVSLKFSDVACIASDGAGLVCVALNVPANQPLVNRFPTSKPHA